MADKLPVIVEAFFTRNQYYTGESYQAQYHIEFKGKRSTYDEKCGYCPIQFKVYVQVNKDIDGKETVKIDTTQLLGYSEGEMQNLDTAEALAKFLRMIRRNEKKVDDRFGFAVDEGEKAVRYLDAANVTQVVLYWQDVELAEEFNQRTKYMQKDRYGRPHQGWGAIGYLRSWLNGLGWDRQVARDIYEREMKAKLETLSA